LADDESSTSLFFESRKNDYLTVTSFDGVGTFSNYVTPTMVPYLLAWFLLLVVFSRTVQSFSPSTGRSSRRNAAISTTTAIQVLVDEIDTVQALESSSFPILPNDLIQRAKEVLAPEIGIGTKDGGECLADNFQFCAAVVGPLGKVAYLNALQTFRLEDSFDIHQNMFGFMVSPIQLNRVYWFSHANATMIADFAGAKVENVLEPLVFPPQCFHMDFDAAGKVTEFGFYTVDRQYGNTGGLGGAFGFFYGVGKPLPIREGRPFQPSFKFRLLQWVGKLGEKLKSKQEG
jgi:hypothetical protein